MKVSRRIENLPPYLFVEISRKISEKRAKGEDVVTFAIGDPDIPTPEHIINRLCQTARDPVNHRYPESAGLPELCHAIAEWYQRRFNVTLNPNDEVVPVIGAKEGIGHIPFCYIDPGDIALVPDPGYPVYAVGTRLAGGEVYYMPLLKENDFLPLLDSIPAEVIKRTKLLWLNYPNNPTGAVANHEFFEQVVQFATKNDIAVCHDGPYTEVAYEGYQPISFLQVDRAKDVGIEFHSLSKSYNMTGWRIGMAVGNRSMIDSLRRLKSNLDSGIPQAIQYMAIEALTGPQESITEHNEIYQRRRDMVVETLNEIGLETTVPQATLYVWAKVPAGYTSMGFAADLLEEANVVVTPGIGYGNNGEGYVRLSLTTSDEAVAKGLSRMADWYTTKSK